MVTSVLDNLPRGRSPGADSLREKRSQPSRGAEMARFRGLGETVLYSFGARGTSALEEGSHPAVADNSR